MSIIYIGSIYIPGQIDELKSLGSSVDFAAETFQSSLLEGLHNYYPNIKIITAPNISNYPRINKKIFKRKEFNLSFNDTKHIFTGFVNIPIIKHISKIIRVRHAIKSSLDSNSNNKILIYGVHSPFLLALCGINKKKYKSCLIVPDLPEFMSEKKNLAYIIGKKIDRFFINIGLKRIDSYVLFSPHMQEYLPIKNKPWINVEGIFNVENMLKDNVDKEDKHTILYTGNISKRMGIPELLEAFSLIESNNYRLWIRGNGECKSMIMDAIKKDNRIEYFEPMSKEDLLKLQKRATVLINPVSSSQKFTRYFFPSKTMEYLASGTPTIMSKLDCLPEEYNNHIYFFEDENIDGIKNKIIEICKKPQTELDSFGKAASDFIISEKNEKKQAKKIVDLINNL